MFACDESTSMLCAREIRGNDSIAKSTKAFTGQRCDAVLVVGLQQRDQDLPGTHLVELGVLGRAHLEHDVGFAENLGRTGDDSRAGRDILFVGHACAQAGARFHAYGVCA